MFIHIYVVKDDFIKLNELFKDIKFDIIINDGSHITSHQQNSFGFLFPFLNSNGIYICEDLHTSYNNLYINTKETTLEIFKNYKITKKINSEIINNKYINDNIVNIQLYEKNKNALKCFNCQTINNNNNSNCLVCHNDLSPNCKSITNIILHKFFYIIS